MWSVHAGRHGGRWSVRMERDPGHFHDDGQRRINVWNVSIQSREAIGIGAELLAADGGTAFGSRRFDHYCSFSEYVGREDASGCKPW